MTKTYKLKDRIISLIMAVVMVITILPLQPVTAYAEETGTTVCTHHVHNEECGYAAAVEEVPCVHTHDESCGYVAAVEEVLCECTDTDENGAVLHTENCGYIPAAEEVPCTHTHDENCGYAPAVAGTPCTWTAENCAECNPADDGEAEPAVECSCETDDETVHAANCPLYTPVENPQCCCVEKCTEPNFWCDICGFDVTACQGGADEAAVYDNYNLWIGGVQVTSENKDNITGEGMTGTATYDPDSNILTLNNYSYIGEGYERDEYFCAVIYCTGIDTLNLLLVGENSVTLTNTSDGKIPIKKHGVYADGDITVSGTGSLTVTGKESNYSSYGVYAGGSITVSDSASLTATGGNAGDYNSYGVCAKGGITVSDTASLTGTGGTTHSWSYGVYADGGITVSDTGSLTGTGGMAEDDSYGVRTYKDITVSGNGSLTATGTGDEDSYGVRATGDITVSGRANLTAKSNGTTTYSYGVDTNGTTTIKGGTVEAQSNSKGRAFDTAPITETHVVYDANGAVIENPDWNTLTYAKIVEKEYVITISNDNNGTAEADKTIALKNDTVTLTVKPNANYRLENLTVGGTNVTALVKDSTYTFTMPAEDVTVSATFKVCLHESYADGKCTVCGAQCSHTGGTATCKKQAVCTVCGESYGDKNINNHVSEAYTYTDNGNGTHAQIHECCGTIADEDATHTFGADGKCTVCGAQCSHTGGTATCKEQAVCTNCGGSYGDKNINNHVSEAYTYTDNGNGTHAKIHECCGTIVDEKAIHTFGTDGKCACDVEARAKIDETYYFTFAEAAEKVTAENNIIDILTDVTIGEDETITFAKFAELKVADGKNINCSGTVKIGEADGIIFENKLYYLGKICEGMYNDSDKIVGIDLDTAKPNTYYRAGEGYAIYEGDGSLILHNAEITTPDMVESSTNPRYAIYSPGDLTIFFSGKNRLKSGKATEENETIHVDGNLTLTAVGENAELTAQCGDSDGPIGIMAHSLTVNGGTVTAIGSSSRATTIACGIYVYTSLTVNSGTVYAHGNGGIMSFGVYTVDENGMSTGTISVADGAAFYATGSEGELINIGVLVATVSGNVNALGVALSGTEDAVTADFTVYGEVILDKDFTAFNFLPSEGGAEDYIATITFTVPEGTSLTVKEGVTLDLSYLAKDDIHLSGTIINNGTIKFPADFDLENAPKDGTVYIGEKSYTWSDTNKKWACADTDHIWSGDKCTVCGVQAYNLYVGGEQFIENKLTISGTTGTATYDPATNTLTLNNYTYTGEGHWWNDANNPDSTYGAVIYYGGSDTLKLELIGESNITYQSDDSSNKSYGIYSIGSIEVSGEGSLNATGDIYGVMCDGDITVNGGSLNATGNNGTAVSCDGDITVNDGSLNATGNNGTAVYCRGDITINGGSLTAHGNNGTTVSCNGDLTVNGGSMTAYGNNGNTVWCNGDLTITGGSLTATGNKTAVSCNGNLTVHDGSLNATGNSNYAVNCNGNLTVHGGSLNVTGNSFAVNCSSDLTVNGGSLTATGSDFAVNCRNDITVNGGSLTAIVHNTIAVRCGSDIIVNGGSLTATGATPGSFAGVDYGDTIAFNGGEVLVRGIPAFHSNSGFSCGNGYYRNNEYENFSPWTEESSAGEGVYFAFVGADHVTVAHEDGKHTISCKDADCLLKLSNAATDGPMEYIYTANDNTITATCSAGCGYSETAAIIAEGKTYDGTAFEATVSYSDSWPGSEPFAITYTGITFGGETYSSATAPTEAGTYKAFVTFEGVTATADFTISKAAQTVTAPTVKQNLVYTGHAQGLIETDTTNAGEMLYSFDKDGEYTQAVPCGTDAGEYTIWYYVKGNNNYTDTEPASVSASIAKAELERSDFVFIAPDDLEYDGTEKKATVTPLETGVGEITIHYYDYYGKETKPVNADTYTVRIEVSEGDNYLACASSNFGWSFTIEKATPVYTTPADITGVYGDTLAQVSLPQEFSWTDSLTVIDETGEKVFTAVYTPTDTTNYTTVQDIPVTVTVSRRPLTVVSAGAAPKIYDGTTDAEVSFVTLGNIITGDDVTAIATGKYSVPDAMPYSDVVITVTGLEGTDADKYCMGDENTFKTRTSVSPAAITVKPNAASRTYGTDDPVFEYEITEGQLYGTDKLTGALGRTEGENVGGYDYTIGTLANPNYTITLDTTNKFAITKAFPRVTEVYAEIPANETSAAFVTITGTVNTEGTFTVEDPSATLVWGENLVRYIFTPADTANYRTIRAMVIVTVTDTIVPTGKVTVEENSWKEFINDITFGLFFNKTVDVTVTATDELSGVKSVEYFESSTPLTLSDVRNVTDWTDMGADHKVSVAVEPDRQFIYYIRITDNAGNVAYISTDGAEFDTQPPVINGITDGATYYTTQRFTVEERNLENVTVNGNQSIAFALGGNVDKEYIVVATDKAGNSTTVTVQMKTIASISETIKELTEENVTGDNTDALKAVEDALAAVDTIKATEAEKAEIAEAQSNIDTLQKVVEDTAAEVKALEDILADYDKDTVKSTDEAAVDRLVADLTEKLDDANLSAQQKTALETALADAQALAQQIDADKAAFEDANNSVPNVDTENVTADNSQALDDAKDKLKDIVNNDNYTEEQQKAAQEQIDKIEELEKVIEETKEAVNDAIAKPDYEDVTADTVTTDDKQTVEDNIAEIDSLLNNTNVSDSQKEELQAAKDAAQDLLDKIAEDQAAKDTAIGAQQAVTDENVTADDAQKLEAAKAALEALKADDNYTEAEKAEIQEEIERIEELEKVIAETETSVDKAVAEEGYADKTEADITSAEKDDIEANLEDIKELLGTDNLTEEQREALEDTKAETEKLLAEIKENSEILDNALKAEEGTTADNYHLSDKENLKAAVESLKAVTDESNKNYTTAEKQAAQTEISRVEAIIADIEETETVITGITNAAEKVAAIADVKAIPDSEEAVDAVIAVLNAYNNLTGRQKELAGDELKQNINNALAKITAYEIINGDNGEHTKGSSKGLEFTVNGLFKLFKEVRVNGNVLIKDTDYTAVAGSTVVTLSSDYLKALPDGTYTLEVVYNVLGTDYTADCEFSVKAKPVESTPDATVTPTDNVPKTGDNTNTVGWMAVMLSSMAVLAVVLKKKKEYEGR